MNIVITDEALTDLEHIGDFIAKDNPSRADSFVAELVDHCFKLADMPRAFPLVPRYEHTGVRRLPHGNYLIFYHIGTDRIDILHILNGAQDYEAILFPSE
ncbi:type II toxin-antitoxin system RelE/ParE family toxin [Mesorhizobium silamurunense]|uniref:type II toxin-antitoxin system RelE/ParE family toxin n=1 Tax=Mesorhizobium silamurunense TaxID=499528 RepID=UPI00177AD479|nr:type II toxin-antitoxin system RelE/ParE family toxin [Mesorhizobium silamurunense]